MSAVKEGYKMTEVGVIPRDWEVVCLADIGEFKNGINKSNEDFGHGFPFVNLMDVFGIPRILSNESFGLINSNSEERRLYNLIEGDVIFVRSSVKPSGVGLTAVVLTNLEDTVFSGFLIRFRFHRQIHDEFKVYCFHQKEFRDRLISSSSVSANTNINQNALKRLLVTLPPTLEEQHAIATALSDVDALISGLDKLIEKKKAIKQGAMQELLTGKTRLAGFGDGAGYKITEVGRIPEDWSLFRIGDISDSFSGGTPSTSMPDYYNGYISWITSSELNQGRIHQTEGFISQRGLDNSSAKLVKKGTFLLAMYGATAGVPAISEIDGAINQAILAIISERVESEYLFQFFSLFKENIISTYTQGGQPNLSGHIIKTIKIQLPSSLDEQHAIATVLSDMDSEIQSLETKRMKYAEVKQGMMQELLTGKIRLI